MVGIDAEELEGGLSPFVQGFLEGDVVFFVVFVSNKVGGKYLEGEVVGA